MVGQPDWEVTGDPLRPKSTVHDLEYAPAGKLHAGVPTRVWYASAGARGAIQVRGQDSVHPEALVNTVIVK